MINASENRMELDLSYLREISGDSPEFMIEMLDTLVEQIPIYLADLQSAVDLKNWQAVSEHAHKVKPTFYYLGRADLKDQTERIELNARQLANLDSVAVELASVNAAFVDVLSHVAVAKSNLKARL